MTDKPNTDLLPCPFCGGEAEFVGSLPKSGYDRVTCTKCFSEYSGDDEAMSVYGWNTRADLAPMVKPLEWSKWGGEWDANNPVGGTFTVKIDGDSGFYLFTKEHTKATDFIEVVQDRSTPDDCMKQAYMIVSRQILSALDMAPDAAELSYEHLRQHGWAPGNYNGFCSDCGIAHVADKRAWRCLVCAEAKATPITPAQAAQIFEGT